MAQLNTWVIWDIFTTILETMCEKDQQTLRCYGNKRIHITTAFWGREDKGICKQLINTGKCSSSTILQRVKTMCNGKHQCNIIATKRHLGNPGCWFWVKLYFQTTYMCIERKNFLHENNIHYFNQAFPTLFTEHLSSFGKKKAEKMWKIFHFFNIEMKRYPWDKVVYIFRYFDCMNIFLAVENACKVG